MSLSYLLVLGAMLALTGCTPPDVQAVWPEPRSLGKDLPVYQPPSQPPAAGSVTREVIEPTGILTLPQAQALVLLHNPKLATFAWEVRAGEARTLQASLPPNPEAGIEVENFAGSGELRSFDSAEITIHLSQLIELAGKRRKRTHVAALERDLTAWDYETTRVDVLTQVTQAFVAVLSAQENVRLQEELVRLAQQVLTTVGERVKAGKVSPVEETRAMVALSTSQIELERAQQALVSARHRLVAAWGSTVPTFTRAEGQLDAMAALPPARQLTERLAQNPDLARWVTEMAQRQAALELEEARRVPDPTIGGGFRYVRETDDHAFVMELSLPLPVFDRNQGNRLEARYRLAKAEEEHRAATVQAHAALGEAYAALAAAYAAATALKNDALPGAQSAFDATSEGYRQGKFGFLDVLDAQRTLFEVRGQYIEALATYHQAVADVERLIGDRLPAVSSVPGLQRNGGKQ